MESDASTCECDNALSMHNLDQNRTNWLKGSKDKRNRVWVRTCSFDILPYHSLEGAGVFVDELVLERAQDMGTQNDIKKIGQQIFV